MLRIPLPEDDGFALHLLKRCARRGGKHTASGCATVASGRLWRRTACAQPRHGLKPDERAERSALLLTCTCVGGSSCAPSDMRRGERRTAGAGACRHAHCVEARGEWIRRL